MNLLDEAEKLAIAAAAVKQQVDQATAKGTVKLSAAIESAKQAGDHQGYFILASVGKHKGSR